MDDKQQKALESNFRAAGGSPRSSARKPACQVQQSHKGNRDSLSFQFQDFREYGYDGANRLQKIKNIVSTSLR